MIDRAPPEPPSPLTPETLYGDPTDGRAALDGLIRDVAATDRALRLALLVTAAFALGLTLGALLWHPAHAQELSMLDWTPAVIDAHIDAAAAAQACACADSMRAAAEHESRYREVGFLAIAATNPTSGAYGVLQFIPDGGVWDACPSHRRLYDSTPDEQFSCAAWAFAHGYGSAWGG